MLAVSHIRKVPHLRKHGAHDVNRRTFNPYPGVIPVTIRTGNIEILVSNVESAGVADMSVNYRQLPVIPVIHKNRQDRHGTVENITLYAFAGKLTHKIIIDKYEAYDIIIEYSAINSFGRFSLQNSMKRSKRLTVLYRIVFKIDSTSRVIYVFKLSFETISGTVKISDIIT